MFAVIYLPQFSLQAVLRHEPALWTKAVALVDSGERAPVVCEMTDAARAAGVAAGLTPTQAMARCSSVLMRPRSPGQENAATAALLQCAYAFSPNLERTGPGLCTLDLRNLASLTGLHAGPPADPAVLEKWAARLQAALAGTGLSAAIGMGPTPTVARHAARWGKGIEVVENPGAFMDALPIAALDASPEVALILKRWGIRTVGELLALGQDALSARLGLEALALRAAASSTAIRPLQLAHPPERFEESFEFEPEVETLEPLLFVLRRFIDQLSPRLELRGWVAESLVLQLTLESGEKRVTRLRIPQPTCQPDVLFRALDTHLETVRADSPIQRVGLAMLPTEAEQKQLGLFEMILCDPRQFQETLARLEAVLGPERIGTPALGNSHCPEDFRVAAPDFENAPVVAERPELALNPIAPWRCFRPSLKAEVQSDSGAGFGAATPCLAGACRATGAAGAARAAHRTPPIAAAKPSLAPCFARPVSIGCALSRGRLKLVKGPWRASGRWWEPAAWQREDWDATTDNDRTIRLVQQLEGWFVEGVMD